MPRPSRSISGFWRTSPSAGYVNLAIAQARQRRFDQARRTLNKGLARIPDSEILLVRLGHTHLVTGGSREAFETMNRS